jgi:hypothetical protein
MRLTRTVKFAGWTALAIVVAMLAFVGGRELKPDEDPYYVFQTDAAAYDEVGAIAAVSKGGFTGFGDLEGGDNRTVVAGRIVEITPSSLVLESANGSRTTLRLGQQPKLARLLPADRDLLRPGATVQVRKGGSDDEAAAVLVIAQP